MGSLNQTIEVEDANFTYFILKSCNPPLKHEIRLSLQINVTMFSLNSRSSIAGSIAGALNYYKINTKRIDATATRKGRKKRMNKIEVISCSVSGKSTLLTCCVTHPTVA